jgi:hypothetical protein
MTSLKSFRPDRPSILAAFVFALLVAALVFAADAGASSGAKGPHAQKVSLLYVLNARRATLLPQKGSKSGYRLAIEGSQPDAVWFSDRPARKSGAFPARFLVDDWAGFGFSSDPPNVAVDYVDSNGRDRTAMLVLRDPQQRKNEFVFSARLLDPRTVKDANLASHIKAADDTPPRWLGDVALFIDDGSAPVVNGCILQPGTSCTGYGTYFDERYLPGIDVSGANFSQAIFINTEFNGGNFTEANFSETNLESHFENSEMAGVDLSGAFVHSIFERTNLSGANLSGAHFYESHFEDANLSGAQVNGVSWEEASFCRTVMPNGTENNSGCWWP